MGYFDLKPVQKSDAVKISCQMLKYMSLNVCLIMGPFKICKNIYVKPIKDGVCIFVLKYFYYKTYQYNYLICKFILTEIFLTWPFATAVNVWHRFSSSNR